MGMFAVVKFDGFVFKRRLFEHRPCIVGSFSRVLSGFPRPQAEESFTHNLQAWDSLVTYPAVQDLLEAWLEAFS